MDGQISRTSVRGWLQYVSRTYLGSPEKTHMMVREVGVGNPEVRERYLNDLLGDGARGDRDHSEDDERDDDQSARDGADENGPREQGLLARSANVALAPRRQYAVRARTRRPRCRRAT